MRHVPDPHHWNTCEPNPAESEAPEPYDDEPQRFCARCNEALTTMARPGDVANLVLERDRLRAAMRHAIELIRNAHFIAAWHHLQDALK